MPATGWGGTGAAAARGERGAARRVHISWRILQSFITDRATPPPDRCRFFGSPCVPSPVSGIRMPKLPLLLKNRKVSNLGALVSGIRMPKLPLLPLWEKGAGGMRGNGARDCGKSLITPRIHPSLRDSPALSTRTTKCHSVTNRRTGAQQDVSPIDGGQMCCYTTHQKKRGTALDRCSPQRRNP
jgi:hypothetical protein